MAVMKNTGVTHIWGSLVTAVLNNLPALVVCGDEAHSLHMFSHQPFCECHPKELIPQL